MRWHLQRIEAYDRAGPQLHAVQTLHPGALTQAQEREGRLLAGQTCGRLCGIPVIVKDNLDTADLPTTAGALALRDHRPARDATVVQRLVAEGAVVLGKAAMSELGNALAASGRTGPRGTLAPSAPQGFSSLGGFVRNPYDPRPDPEQVDGRGRVTPGGSSSGSAVAVAAALALAGLGTETAGSILKPAVANQVVGLKPTQGLVSRAGLLPVTLDQDTVGPIARTVEDVALLLGVMAGHDPADPSTDVCKTEGRCLRDYTHFLDPGALKGARIAAPHAPYWDDLDAGQQARMSEAIQQLRRLGAVVDDGEHPAHQALAGRPLCTSHPSPPGCSTALLYGVRRDLDAYLRATGPGVPVKSLAGLVAWNDAHPQAIPYGQELARAAAALDPAPDSADTRRYQADRATDLQVARAALDGSLAGPDGQGATADDYDAVLFPSARGANAAGRSGYPAIAVPAGEIPGPPSPDGTVRPVPFGLSLVGKPFAEGRLLALAYAFEQATRHRRLPPTTPPLPPLPAVAPSR